MLWLPPVFIGNSCYLTFLCVWIKTELYTSVERLLTNCSAKCLRAASPSPTSVPAVSFPIMSGHFCAFSSCLFLGGKGYDDAFEAFRREDASHASTTVPQGESTAGSSWRGHFSSRSSCKRKAINFGCEQTMLLIFSLESGGLTQMLLSPSPSGLWFPSSPSLGWQFVSIEELLLLTFSTMWCRTDDRSP